MARVSTTAELEIRCRRCAVRHPARKAPLLATVRGTEVLLPVRMDGAQAKRLGIPRAGLFWRKPTFDPEGRAVLRCRRCGQVTYYRPE